VNNHEFGMKLSGHVNQCWVELCWLNNNRFDNIESRSPSFNNFLFLFNSNQWY
jgi:hypothetical protein